MEKITDLIQDAGKFHETIQSKLSERAEEYRNDLKRELADELFMEETLEENKFHADGASAAQAGKSASDNPHKPNTVAHHFWNKGHGGSQPAKPQNDAGHPDAVKRSQQNLNKAA